MRQERVTDLPIRKCSVGLINAQLMPSQDQWPFNAASQGILCSLLAVKLHKCIALVSMQLHKLHWSEVGECLVQVFSGVVRWKVAHKDCGLGTASTECEIWSTACLQTQNHSQMN